MRGFVLDSECKFQSLVDCPRLHNFDIRWPGFALAQAFWDYGSLEAKLGRLA